MVTTNDSRIRLIDTASFKQIRKFKGFKNDKVHIKSDYCYEREMILSGSEDGKIYIWNKTYNYIPPVNPKFDNIFLSKIKEFSRFIPQKINTSSSYECFVPFQKDFPICCVVAPFQFYDLAKRKLLNKGMEVFLDLIFLAVSNKAEYKVFGNFIGI